MHAPHRCAQVHRFYPRFAGNYRANSRSARGVILHNELTERYIALSRYSLDQSRRNKICGVPLVIVGLNYDSLIYLDCVVGLVLLGVVGMHRMRHVS